MKRKRVLLLGGISLALLIAYGSSFTGAVSAQTPAPAAPPRPVAAAGAPSYRVEPLWPKPLPMPWAFGAVSGVAVDSMNHVWVVHRGADSMDSSEKTMGGSSMVCCSSAPAVLEFDPAGTLVSWWGGKDFKYADWPQSTGGIAVDSKGNVWVAAFGLVPAAAGGRGRGRGADPDAPAVATPPAGRAAAPPAAPGAGGAAPPAGGRGRGGAAAGGAAPAAGTAPAAGGAPPAGGGRGRGGAAAAGGTAPAAGTTAPAGTTAAQEPPAAARGRGAAAAPAAPALADAHVTKYTRTGQFLLRIGTPGTTGTDQTHLNHPAGFAIDEAANEVYVADSGNHRIVVFDMNTGAFKRQWGGSGEAPTAAGAGAYDPAAAPSKQFRDPTCVKIAKDNTVYVCDRTSNRIQVFQKSGTFVKEMIIAKETKGATVAVGQAPGIQLNSSGSVWDIAFSPDAAQANIFVADGHNNRIRILRRDTLAEVGTIGDGGRWPGRFFAPGSVAVDSRGVLYTGEQYVMKRVQKFVRGTAAAPAARGQ